MPAFPAKTRWITVEGSLSVDHVVSQRINVESESRNPVDRSASGLFAFVGRPWPALAALLTSEHWMRDFLWKTERSRPATGPLEKIVPAIPTPK